MSHSLELNALIESRPPLITIESYEEPRLMLLLEQQARLSGQPLYAWCSNDGLRRIDAHNEKVQETFQPEQALRHILRAPQNGIFVLLDIHHFLDNALVQRLVKGIVHDAARTARTLILLSPRLTLPEDLRRLAVRYEPPLPEPALARQLVKEEIDLWLRNSGERVKGERAAVDQLVRHLQGLSHTDVKRLAAQAIRDDGAITMADIERLHHSKYDMLGGDGLLPCACDMAREVVFDEGLLQHVAWSGPAAVELPAQRQVGIQGKCRQMVERLHVGGDMSLTWPHHTSLGHLVDLQRQWAHKAR